MNSSACLREEAFAFLSPGYSGVDDIHVIVDVPPRSRGVAHFDRLVLDFVAVFVELVVGV
ncbi:hypothetical protein PC129_g23858 [Phytophthora cactorum]|nr:hypothetical protein PC112_g24156 [Phytophthora cactorum]KAG2808027.1 hypothetical protein PC113_g23990 [Phytophthora cactorum]KAG2812908.1 hypothetical protein PC111_g14619 [Phytophthora cactorum]KAG2957008.1 hypothetical protein PC118_g24217 [Phytophthora cactorum]KAG2969547.1 hypothetical protein PC120_g26690 [Phytophthora cactorum]